MALSADGISVPHEHDVLSGRGKDKNNHLGNRYFRAVAKFYQPDYVKTNKGVAYFAQRIVDDVKARDPPGRFLIQDEITGKWKAVGEDRALLKAKQALREGAPALREKICSDGLPTLVRSEGHVSLNDAVPVKEKFHAAASAPAGSGTVSPDSVAQTDRKAPHGRNEAACILQEPFDEEMPPPVPSDRSIPLETFISDCLSLGAFQDQSILTDFSMDDLSGTLKADPNDFDEKRTEDGGWEAFSGRSLLECVNMRQIEVGDSSRFQLSVGSSQRAQKRPRMKRRNSETSLRRRSGLTSEMSGMIQYSMELEQTSLENLHHCPQLSDRSSRRWSFAEVRSDRSMDWLAYVWSFAQVHSDRSME